MTILGWFEHLSEDDMPPPWMWHLNDELERHFTIVKERRNAGSSRPSDDVPDVGPMIHNEYARGRGREAPVRNG
jgi:hypothetical protein